jgi:FkbM family methyltransferase
MDVFGKLRRNILTMISATQRQQPQGSAGGDRRLWAGIVRRRRMLLHVWRHEGLAAALWEIAYQVLQPFVNLYTKAKWRHYQKIGHLSFTIAGSQMRLLSLDKGVSAELAVHRTHEPCASELLSQSLKPGMTFIDIGSNLGYYSLLANRIIGPTGRIVAIEPMPQNADVSRHNFLLNGAAKIIFRQIAISDHNGFLPLHLSDKSNWHSLNPVPWPTRELLVPACTLDSLATELSLSRVDFIRMDLEGYETTVVNGMVETIAKHSPRLFVELHPHIVGIDPIREYLARLAELGYFPEWVLDQERDVPLRWRFLKPEHMSMCRLRDDWRINIHPRSLNVLFGRTSHGKQISMHSDWRTPTLAAIVQQRA